MGGLFPTLRAALFSMGATATLALCLSNPAMAAPHRPHGGGGQHHGSHGGGHPRFHGGHGPQFGHPHPFGPHHGRPHVGRGFGPRVVYRGGRTIVVDRPYAVYAGHGGHHRPYAGGFGPGCSTSRHVSLTPSGWHKIVTTKVCYVP